MYYSVIIDKEKYETIICKGLKFISYENKYKLVSWFKINFWFENSEIVK